MTDQGSLFMGELTASTARFSADGVYRYDLTRTWGEGKRVLWVMLNPSTATASDDDPTIRRCIGFSKDWGYGGLVVCNLYALRSTNPKGLLAVDDPIGPENETTIRHWMTHPSIEMMVCAWGAHVDMPNLPRRLTPERWTQHLPVDPEDEEFGLTDYRWVPSTFCLGRSKNGHPRHPLYLKRDADLLPYPAL